MFGRQASLMKVSKAELKEIEQLKKESLKGKHVGWDKLKKVLFLQL
ncbi:MAG: hypothetical protein WCE94_01710 [Candidatus Methanoperedens sp.]